MIKKNILMMLGIGFGGLVAGYFLGSLLGGGDKPADLADMRGQFGPGGQIPGQTAQRKTQFGGSASGEILSIDDKSITIKTRDGGSRIILFASTTPIYKSVTGTGADLKVNTQISTFGKSGSDGSIVAESIQIVDSLKIPMAPINQ